MVPQLTSKAPAFIARQATGLVREAGWFDMILFRTRSRTPPWASASPSASGAVLTALVRHQPD